MSTAPLYFSCPVSVHNASFPIVSICTDHFIGPKTDNSLQFEHVCYATLLHRSSNFEISANLSSCTFTFHKSFNVSSFNCLLVMQTFLNERCKIFRKVFSHFLPGCLTPLSPRQLDRAFEDVSSLYLIIRGSLILNISYLFYS